MPNRDEQFVEKDVREAAQGALWLRRVVECYSDDLEVEYEDTLAASGLPEEIRPISGGRPRKRKLLYFARRDLRRLEEAASGEGEQLGGLMASIARRDLMRCGSRPAGGWHAARNPCFFGFRRGMLRKAGGCR